MISYWVTKVYCTHFRTTSPIVSTEVDLVCRLQSNRNNSISIVSVWFLSCFERALLTSFRSTYRFQSDIARRYENWTVICRVLTIYCLVKINAETIPFLPNSCFDWFRVDYGSRYALRFELWQSKASKHCIKWNSLAFFSECLRGRNFGICWTVNKLESLRFHQTKFNVCVETIR